MNFELEIRQLIGAIVAELKRRHRSGQLAEAHA